MPKDQLINLINTLESKQPSQLKEFISKLSKKQVVDYIFYNHGHLYSKTKNEIYKCFNYFTQDEFKNDVIRKYIK